MASAHDLHAGRRAGRYRSGLALRRIPFSARGGAGSGTASARGGDARSAYAALVAFALVGHVHMRAGWRVPELRSAALWLCTVLVLLALTGLGFYYAPADEVQSSFLRWSHVAAGLLLPLWLALHIVRGRRLPRRP